MSLTPDERAALIQRINVLRAELHLIESEEFPLQKWKKLFDEKRQLERRLQEGAPQSDSTEPDDSSPPE